MVTNGEYWFFLVFFHLATPIIKIIIVKILIIINNYPFYQLIRKGGSLFIKLETDMKKVDPPPIGICKSCVVVYKYHWAYNHFSFFEGSRRLFMYIVIEIYCAGSSLLGSK